MCRCTQRQRFTTEIPAIAKKHRARATKCNAKTHGPFLSNAQTPILIDFTMNKESEIAQALNLFGNSLTAGDQDALRGVFTDFFCEQSGAQTRTDDFLDEEGLSADEEGLSDSSDDEFEEDAPGLPSSCYQDDDEDTSTEDTAIIRPPPLLEEDRSMFHLMCDL